MGMKYFYLFLAFALINCCSATDRDKEECPADNESEQLKNIMHRDFTLDQLSTFVGAKCGKIYVGYRNIAVDATKLRSIFGSTGICSCMAGKNAHSNADILNHCTSDNRCSLTTISLYELIQNSPIIGLISEPTGYKQYSLQELSHYTTAKKRSDWSYPPGTPLRLVNGTSPAHITPSEITDRRIYDPVLIAFRGKVFDVAYGSVHLYGKDLPPRPEEEASTVDGITVVETNRDDSTTVPVTTRNGPYSSFAGKDVTKAFLTYKEVAFDNSQTTSGDDTSSITATLQQRYEAYVKECDELATKYADRLKHWEQTIYNTKRYPMVGEVICC